MLKFTVNSAQQLLYDIQLLIHVLLIGVRTGPFRITADISQLLVPVEIDLEIFETDFCILPNVGNSFVYSMWRGYPNNTVLQVRCDALCPPCAIYQS